MGSLTKQLSRLFNPKLVRKHFPKGNTTRLRAESSSQNSHGQGFRPKSGGPVGSNGSAPGLVDNQPESGTAHEDDCQHHLTSDEIWDIFLKPGPLETKEGVKPFLQKKQYPALLSPAELQSLEQPSPPPNKPLPQIPTQAQPRTTPQRVPREAEDRRVPSWNLQNTRPQARKIGATYSPFPKPIAFPLRASSITSSSRCPRETHKPQRPSRPNTTATKQAHRHIAELHNDLSKEKEKTIEEPHEEAIQELLAQVVRKAPDEKSVAGSSGRNSFHPLDEFIVRTEVEVAQPFPRSPLGLNLFLPPGKCDWDKNTPTLSRPSSPKDLRREASSETSSEATAPARRTTKAAAEGRPKTARDHAHRSTTASQETRPKLTTHGRRPTGASFESGANTSSLESRPTATSEASPKASPRERPVFMVSRASQFAIQLPTSDSDPAPVFTKKSAPNLRRATKLEPLQLPPLHQLPLLPPLYQLPLVPRRDDPVFAHDDGGKCRRFGFLRIHRRGSSEGRGSSKNNSLAFKWRRSSTDSPPTSPRG
ncbi:hypothetical protein B0T10DRAFT_196230 [Thelonectria olida]|uniref:Uncharacterized protein n=1 Tax=Thelonectria olida TaxID=1576542 RepID=A0A9P9AJ48_9HYPO|nr:hypothetical protein B0T10DRAFT_196230 [Thelonectria olida]